MPQEDKQYRRKYDKTADTDRDGYLRGTGSFVVGFAEMSV